MNANTSDSDITDRNSLGCTGVIFKGFTESQGQRHILGYCSMRTVILQLYIYTCKAEFHQFSSKHNIGWNMFWLKEYIFGIVDTILYVAFLRHRNTVCENGKVKE